MIKNKILIVVPINMNFVINTPSISQLSQNVFGNNFRMVPGDKGANQAIAVARLVRRYGTYSFSQ